ncbi:hypothetical protein V8G54_012185 [Vigna mungo]|uniref:Uncharacterized protein n=1 Tax=Vigna mungo TaxID=3915 RepID=A0AAQ3S0C5_VIGMU
MAPPRGAVGVKLQLSVLGLDGLCFFQNMFEVSLSDEGSVAFVKGEFVEPFFIRRTIDRKGVIFRGDFVGTPPELHPLELLYDLFVVIHAKNNRGVCVFDFDDFSSEPCGVLGRVFAEVGLDGSVGFTFDEAFAGEFVEGDSDVRVDEGGEFVGVPSNTGLKS